MGKKAGYWVSSHSVTSFDMSSGMSVSEKVGKRTTAENYSLIARHFFTGSILVSLVCFA